ncbi:hypothetical protein ACH4C6_36085, partial [Streptomyces sp. NPDC017943]|uniref:hypothetical protein n=1 Tax=Streptomyces sp. NPDC017943 TaxID=3365019 RepID=UPI0037A8FAEA
YYLWRRQLNLIAQYETIPMVSSLGYLPPEGLADQISYGDAQPAHSSLPRTTMDDYRQLQELEKCSLDVAGHERLLDQREELMQQTLSHVLLDGVQTQERAPLLQRMANAGDRLEHLISDTQRLQKPAGHGARTLPSDTEYSHFPVAQDGFQQRGSRPADPDDFGQEQEMRARYACLHIPGTPLPEVGANTSGTTPDAEKGAAAKTWTSKSFSAALRRFARHG